MKRVIEPVTKSFENTSQGITKNITETSIKHNQAIENLNNKLLEIMNDRCILASYLMCPLSKISNAENSTQFRQVKYSNSNRVHDLLINNTIPITLHDNLLTFHDIGKIFKLKDDLLEMITYKNYIVDLAKLSDKKSLYEFAKEMNFDLKASGKKSTSDGTHKKLLKSPRLMVSASGVSKTKFLSSDPDEFCDRLKLSQQEKQAGNNSETFNQKIVAIDDKLLEYKCLLKKDINKFQLNVIF